VIIEMLGKWLAGSATLSPPDARDIEARVQAVIQRVDALELRMKEVERCDERQPDERQ
jgi:hypothetical protein